MFLVRKKGGVDHGKLFAMKVLKKGTIFQKWKTTEYTLTERQVQRLQSPFNGQLKYIGTNIGKGWKGIHIRKGPMLLKTY